MASKKAPAAQAACPNRRRAKQEELPVITVLKRLEPKDPTNSNLDPMEIAGARNRLASSYVRVARKWLHTDPTKLIEHAQN